MDSKDFNDVFLDIEKKLLNTEEMTGFNPLKLFLKDTIEKKKENDKFRNN